MIIRKAVLQDKPTVIDMVKDFLKESNMPLKPDLKQISEGFDIMLDNPSALMLVVQKEDRVVGVLGALLAPSFFSTETSAVELLWYMQPDARDGRAALRLINHYETWAKNKGVRIVAMNDTHNLADLQKLYERKGYQLKEKTYIKVL